MAEMKCFKVIPFLFFLSLCSGNLFSQNQALIDSLEQQLLYSELSDSSRLELLLELAELHQTTDFDKYLEYSEKLRTLSQQLGNKKREAQAYRLMALALIEKQEDLTTVIGLLDTGLSISQQLSDTSLIIRMYTSIGRVYIRNGFHDKAYDFYQQSLALSELIRDTSTIIISMNNMSLILKKEERYERAKTYYKEALKYAEQMPDNKRYLAALNNNLGSIYDRQDSTDIAITYYEASLAIKKELNARYSMVSTLHNIGVINVNKNEFNQANRLFKEGYEIARELDYRDGMALILVGWASCASQQEQYQTAIQRLDEAKEVLGKNGDLYTQMQCYDQLSIAYQAMGNYKLAFDSYTNYDKLKDSIFQKESGDKIDELETKYKVRQTETENKLLKAKQEAAAHNSRNAIIIAMGLFAALMLALGWSYTIYKANAEKKKMNAELEQKVEARTQDLKEANDELQQLNHELKTFNYIASHDLKEPIRNIGNFVGLIQHKLPKDLTSSVSNYFSMIKRSTAQLYSLVEDFSEYSYLSKEAVVELEEVDLTLTAQNLTDHFTSLLQEKNGRFVYNQLPVINTSSSLIYIVLKNLVENGLKFNDSSQPTVELSYQSSDQMHRIIVTDNGIGIEPEYQEMIFDMFKRLHGRESYKGSGMGLAIARLMVRKIKGDIHLYSEPGKGSTFVIELPK